MAEDFHHVYDVEDVRQVRRGGNNPTLAEFLAAPISDVRKIAPATLIMASGGTRRQAVLKGVSPANDDYVHTLRPQFFDCLELILRHGVSHCFVTLLAEMNFSEHVSFRERIIEWTKWAIADPEAMDAYARNGWRIKLVGAESIPELLPVAEKLGQATKNNSGPMVGYLVASNPEAMWTSLFKRTLKGKFTTRSEAIRAVYGEEIKPATMYIGSGKPTIVPSMVPPLLVGDLQCYWTQHLGYQLTERMLRTIFYDYAFVRRTWREDKTGRAEEALAYREAWDNPPTLGVGVRIGPFWYPAPIEAPPVSWSRDVDA